MQVDTVQSALPVNSCIVMPFTGSCVLNQSRIKWCKRSFNDNDSPLSSKHKFHFNEFSGDTHFFSMEYLSLSTQKTVVLISND